MLRPVPSRGVVVLRRLDPEVDPAKCLVEAATKAEIVSVDPVLLGKRGGDEVWQLRGFGGVAWEAEQQKKRKREEVDEVESPEDARRRSFLKMCALLARKWMESSLEGRR